MNRLLLTLLLLAPESAAAQARANSGKTALHDAQDAETVRRLLKEGVPLEARDGEGRTPLWHAVAFRRPGAAAALIAAGADVDTKEPVNGHGPLSVLASSAYTFSSAEERQRLHETLDLFLRAKPDLKGPHNSAALAFAAGGSNRDIEVVRKLIAAGSPVEGQGGGRESPLQVAAHYGNKEIAALLLGAGANPDAPHSYYGAPRATFREKHGVDIETLVPVTLRVNRYVQAKLDAWLKKDEFETEADHAARMRGKRAKVGELMGEAFVHFGVLAKISVGLYDAERETFKLSSPELGDMVVAVPKAKARAFKEGFSSFKFKPGFAPAGEGWKLARLEMSGAGETFFYDASKQAAYEPVVFDVRAGEAVDTRVAARREEPVEPRKVAVAPADDVSRLPAFASAPRPDDVAVVIGVESYRGLPRSAYSKSDAQLVKRYLIAMGFAERNIALLLDEGATANDFKKTLDTWLRNVVKPSSRVLIYYSGHGAPDPATGEGYLVPYDGDPEYLADTAYPLKKLVAGLGRLPAKQSVLLLDSCFSGMGGRSVLAKNARPLVAKTAGPAVGASVAVLTATGSEQISTSSEELGHGVFTYFFLKSLKEGRKDLASVYAYMRPLVEDEARRQNARQSPTLKAGGPAESFRLVD